MTPVVTLNLRHQNLIADAHGYRVWQTETSVKQVEATQIALVLCDVWDHHWCRGAVERLNGMLPRMNAVVQSARKRGVLVVHAPSDTMDYYQGTPGRSRATAAPHAPAPVEASLTDPPLPV
ncbi:MAG: hypothetical protein P1S60_18705, partial [Anaerolineae bacterium]|nr:hypothetical protein [Anaerolineae bacterium]